jgi:hypothetical protein
MILFYLILSGIFLITGYLGYLRLLRLDHLNPNRVINGLLVIAVLLTLMSVGHWFGLFSQSLAVKITMSAYTVVAGFFLGSGIQLIRLRKKSGNLEYMYRSFWTDIAPNLISIALFVFGIYRIGFFHWSYFTGIGVTSGLSLIGFAFFGWTVRIIPEFRERGILLLDQFIEWKKVVAYGWVSEDTLQIDYYTESEQISEFKTYIPEEDQLIIERLLGNKLKEHEEERRKMLMEARETEFAMQH